MFSYCVCSVTLTYIWMCSLLAHLNTNKDKKNLAVTKLLVHHKLQDNRKILMLLNSTLTLVKLYMYSSLVLFPSTLVIDWPSTTHTNVKLIININLHAALPCSYQILKLMLRFYNTMKSNYCGFLSFHVCTICAAKQELLTMPALTLRTNCLHRNRQVYIQFYWLLKYNINNIVYPLSKIKSIIYN